MKTSAVLRLMSILWHLSHVFSAYVDNMEIRNVCELPWLLVYAHTDNGEFLRGNKMQLMNDVLAGKEVKVKLFNFMETYTIRVDSIFKQRNDICAQSVGHLAHNGTHINSFSPRRYIEACTTGYVSIIQDSGTKEMTTRSMFWYTKALSAKGRPVYSNYMDGSPAYGSLQNLWQAGRTMAMHGVMRDRGFVFPMHNVAVDVNTGVVTGQNVKYIGGTYTSSASPYMWYSSWSTTGHRDNKRWLVGQHISHSQNVDNVALDWYADTCWRVVLHHDSTGFPEFGTVQKLIEAVRGGHRIRVTINDVNYEASNLRISGDVVTAQLLHAVVPGGWVAPSRYDIRAETAHRWILASTTGHLRAFEFLVGSPTSSQMPRTYVGMTWHADTRPWRVLLRTEDQGRIVQGDPGILLDAVEQGASIRINLGMDDRSQDFLTEADNIRVDEEEFDVYAQAMNHISDKKAVEDNEYDLQPDTFYWYLMISSRGIVRMSAWFVGTETQKYNKRAPAANITWMANF